jgi:hypothetical protein
MTRVSSLATTIHTTPAQAGAQVGRPALAHAALVRLLVPTWAPALAGVVGRIEPATAASLAPVIIGEGTGR